MKKFLALLVVCFMVLGAQLAKADTRTDSLGLTAGQQVDDLDSIWLYPQNAANFGNVVDTRLGTAINGTVANDWFGVISQEWSDLGYIGVYTKRPFDMSNGIVPSENLDNQFGILNGLTTWAAFLNPANTVQISNTLTDHNAHITATFTNMALPFIAITDPENKLDAFWAKAFSDVTLGLHVNYASRQGLDVSNSETYVANPPAAGSFITTTNDEYSGVLGLDLGLSVKNVLFDSLDASVGYSMGQLDYSSVYNQENNAQNGTSSVTNQTEKDNGINEIRLNGLGVSKVSDTTQGRTFLNIRLDNLGINSDSNETDLGGVNNNAGYVTAQTNTYSDTNINLGYALSHKVLDGKGMVIAGLTAIYDDRNWKATNAANAGGSTSPTQLAANSGETEEETSIVIPFNVAVETPLFSWMKLRFGAYKNIFQTVTDKVVDPTNINGAGTAFQTNNTAQDTVDLPAGVVTDLGIGCAWDNFTLDFQINPNALLAAVNTIAPGQGIIFGNNTAAPQGAGNGVLSSLVETVAQFDMRYAF